MMLQWVLAAVLTLAPVLARAATFGPDAAVDHIGENATVCGPVASAHYASRSRGQPTFLDFGEPYPAETFIAVIWGDDRAKFGTPESWIGQRVCMTGTITRYRGRPEMVLREAGQVRR